MNTAAPIRGHRTSPAFAHGDERWAGGWHARNDPLVVRARLAWAILVVAVRRGGFVKFLVLGVDGVAFGSADDLPEAHWTYMDSWADTLIAAGSHHVSRRAPHRKRACRRAADIGRRAPVRARGALCDGRMVLDHQRQSRGPVYGRQHVGSPRSRGRPGQLSGNGIVPGLEPQRC